VVDASACVALINSERGASAMRRAVQQACVISAVNLAELFALSEQDGRLSRQDWRALLAAQGVQVEPFEESHASESGALWPHARKLAGRVGDGACLALARRKGWTALTTKAKWKAVGEEAGIKVRVLTEDRQP
jgi:ribonuclease VapC